MSFFAVECLFGANRIYVRVNYFEWFVYREVIHKRAALPQTGVAEPASSAIADEMGNIFVHVRPVIAKADAMEGVVEIEMAADGVCMESDKYDISELGWYYLKFDIISDEIDVFVDVYHILMFFYHARSHRLMVDIMDFLQILFHDE